MIQIRLSKKSNRKELANPFYCVRILSCVVSKMEIARVKLVAIFNQVFIRAHAPYINRGTMYNNILTERKI